MADSNITKRALASALKELMLEMPFAKISVSDICKKCSMNRKSFYYHFLDKYDLVNWIFDMDFIGITGTAEEDESIEDVIALCRILYDNRSFYCKALSVHGQNSLSEHIRELALPVLRAKLQKAPLPKEGTSFYFEFFIDALLVGIMRWIMDEKCEPPEQFIPNFLSCIISTSKYIFEKYHNLSEGLESVG